MNPARLLLFRIGMMRGGQTEIPKFHVILAIQEDVRRFKVPVDQVVVMKIVKCIEELVEDLPFQGHFGISLLWCERDVEFFLSLTDEVTKSTVTEFHLDEEDLD